MKNVLRILAVLFTAFALSACTTTGSFKPEDVQRTVDKVCPPVRSAIVLLKVNPDIQLQTLEALNYAGPYIDIACSTEIPPALTNLYELADRAIPVLVTAVSESTLKPNDKEVAIIALTVAQVAIAALR